MRKIFKGFALAVSMLSIVPFFKVHDFWNANIVHRLFVS